MEKFLNGRKLKKKREMRMYLGLNKKNKIKLRRMKCEEHQS